MNINAYVYIDSDRGTLCFTCGVKAAMKQEDYSLDELPRDLDLALEMGATGDGCDMRSTPECKSCGKMLTSYCIG